ncbi:hypothetical protein AX17_002922 [Amanita inopinata Kibby_2008]|nr:hypothetical protein AX17_002922 [Amanita inopinata Kibby_2008]
MSTTTPRDMNLVRTDTSVDYRIDNKRNAVLDGFGPSIPEIDCDTFFQSILPPFPSTNDTNTIWNRLIESRVLCYNADAKRLFWSAFPNGPAKFGCSEDDMFDGLSNIYAAVIGAAPEDTAAIARLSLNPNQAPFSNRTHATWPDGYMMLTETSVKGRNTKKADGVHDIQHVDIVFWKDRRKVCYAYSLVKVNQSFASHPTRILRHVTWPVRWKLVGVRQISLVHRVRYNPLPSPAVDSVHNVFCSFVP